LGDLAGRRNHRAAKAIGDFYFFLTMRRSGISVLAIDSDLTSHERVRDYGRRVPKTELILSGHEGPDD
jgi:hypothetical protein